MSSASKLVGPDHEEGPPLPSALFTCSFCALIWVVEFQTGVLFVPWCLNACSTRSHPISSLISFAGFPSSSIARFHALLPPVSSGGSCQSYGPCATASRTLFRLCVGFVQVCAADIHPAARIGKGILMASGCDIGETAPLPDEKMCFQRKAV